MNGIHIFRKDLRLVDNFALSKLSKLVDNVYLIFFLDNKQIKDDETEYHRSYNAINFMLQSLENLNKDCNNKLNFYIGDLNGFTNKINKLVNELDISYISYNADFTKYAIERDTYMQTNIKCKFIISNDDQSLCNMELLLKKDNNPYITFSHFYNNLLANYKKIKSNNINKNLKFKKSDELKSFSEINFKNKIKTILIGGRDAGLKILKSKFTLDNFLDRDNLSKNNNTYLSAYMNFGCLSIREVANSKLGQNDDFFKQLVWRDFYLCILRFNPIAKEYIWLDDRFNKLKWRNVNTEKFKSEWDLFMNCKTGCLLVDAAMSELLQTGHMNNRARLIWATFAVKYLRSDPFHKLYGAINLFSRYLTDCSTSQNKMNFEWIISSLDLSGRRFSKKGYSPLAGRPIHIDNKQIKKYNAFNYIRTHLPELSQMTDKELLKYPCKIDLQKNFTEYLEMF